MWKSAEFVDGLPFCGATTCASGAAPVLAHSPMLPDPKSMSYAKLYHVPAASGVDHFVTPPIIQRSVLSAPDAPESVPYLSSVKCDSKKAIWCS